MEITLAIAIIGCVLSITTFVLNRKDKSNTDAVEEQKQFDKHNLIEYRLDELTKKIDKILDKLDFYDKEIDEKVAVAMKHHIAEYHK